MTFPLLQQKHFSICYWGRYKEVQFSSVGQSCLTLCDPMDCSMPGFPVHHQLPEPTQTHYIMSEMTSNHLILCHPLLLPSLVLPSIRVFSNESVLHLGGQSIGISALGSVFLLGLTGWISLHSKGLSRVFSNITVQKLHFFSTQLSL